MAATGCLAQPMPVDRMRTIWLLCNAAYIPVAYWCSPVLKSRSIYIDRLIGNTLKALLLHALLFISSLYFIGIDDISWGILAIFYGICFVAIPAWRTTCRLMLKYARRRGLNYKRIVIVGTNSTALRLLETIETDAGLGFRFMGFFDDNPTEEINHDRYRGRIDKLSEFVGREAIDEIYCTLSGEQTEALLKSVSIADTYGIGFNYVPQLSRYVTRGFTLAEVGAIPVMTVRPNPLASGFNRLIKRTIDVVFSSLAIAGLSVFLIPVGIAIKLSSPGPVLFRQKRTGYKGREFECLKLRTMRVNTLSDSEQAYHGDPRITKIGAILRHTSIDELPQLWNVLRGDMSLVGPRPHMLLHTREYSQLIDKYMARHIVKPGITGWAQVNGFRGETKRLEQMERRVEYDVFYIENWSVLFDLKIMCRTVFNIFQGENNAF